MVPPVTGGSGTLEPAGVPGEVSGDLEMANDTALAQLELISHGLDPFDVAVDGHKFGLPEKPLVQGMHLKNRYEPILAQMTRLIMRHGKLSKAQRVRSRSLEHSEPA